jgi:hypothetical protein
MYRFYLPDVEEDELSPGSLGTRPTCWSMYPTGSMCHPDVLHATVHAQDGAASLAGTAPASTGVYVGCVWQEYALYLEHAHVAPTVAVLTGSGMNFMVGRVSYTFGLQGARSALGPPFFFSCY